MAVNNCPTSDFVTSTLSAAIDEDDTSASIGTGLSIPATNSWLQVDYDSAGAVGAANGPETIFYTAYNTTTGALTGVVRGRAGTTGVSHLNGAKVQAGMSAVYLTDTTINDAWTAHTSVITGFSGTPTQAFAYMKIGKTVILRFLINGTSNATSLTFTLPFAPKVSMRPAGFLCDDNSTRVTGYGQLALTASSTTVTACSGSADQGWTASNTKGIQGVITYEAE